MSTTQTIFITKDEAKRMIDESPADMICVTIVDVESQISGDTESMIKSDGRKLIDAAKKVGYQNHCIFGRLELTGGKLERRVMQCIAFAQGSPPTEKYF